MSGLTTSLFTRVFLCNGGHTTRAASVTINCDGQEDITTPFNGYKPGVFGGRDNGLHAQQQCTELKSIWIDFSDDAAAGSLA